MLLQKIGRLHLLFVGIMAIAVFCLWPSLDANGQNCGSITTCQELQSIQSNPSGCYAVANDIDCSETYFWNDGAGFVPIAGFSGRLDGQGHTIRNLMVNRGTDPQQLPLGLFGTTTTGAVISNLKLKGVLVLGYNQNAGGLIGYINGGTNISNVSVEGRVESTIAGGLVGSNEGGNISECSADVQIGGFLASGGLVGVNQSNARIERSFSKGYVGGNIFVGGLVGNHTDSLIANSYSTAYVDGFGYIKDNPDDLTRPYRYTTDPYVGGLVGSIQKINSGFTGPLVTKSYATGKIKTNHDFMIYAGGLIGGANTAAATLSTSSFWDMDSSGLTTSGGGAGVVGKTTAQMKTPATFAGYDFVNTWAPVCDGVTQAAAYPNLKWEGVGCFASLQLTQLNPPTASQSLLFGGTVASDGLFMAVGAPGDSEYGAKAGAVYIYHKDSTTGIWGFTEKVVPPSSAANNAFGKKVALSGNYLAVVQESDAPNTTTASIYVFHFVDGHWQYQTTITTTVNPSISLSLARLAIGSPREKKVDYYVETSGTWNKVSTLHNDRAGDPTADKVRFGSSVALDGDWLVVGAPKTSILAPEKSQIIIYRWQSGAWVEDSYFVDNGNRFGAAVAISGNTIVAGASDFGTMGSIYVFEYATGWGAPKKLTYKESDLSSIWGDAVAIQGDTLIVSGLRDVGLAEAIVFKKVSGVWQEAYVFKPELNTDMNALRTAVKLTSLYQSVAINGSSIILGEGLDSSLGTMAAGSVKVYAPGQ